VIAVYNTSECSYREDSFTVLALNAWELLLKAKWLAAHRNRLSSLYIREGKISKRPRNKRTRAGSSRTHDLYYLARKLTKQKVLDDACRRNLEALTETPRCGRSFLRQKPQACGAGSGNRHGRRQELRFGGAPSSTGTNSWASTRLRRTAPCRPLRAQGGLGFRVEGFRLGGHSLIGPYRATRAGVSCEAFSYKCQAAFSIFW
jgi:hypothetical protein